MTLNNGFDERPSMNPRPFFIALATAVLAAACASLSPARLALPEPLASAPVETFEGLKFGREGRFTLGNQTVRYQRGADRLDLFGLIGRDKVTVRFELDGPNGSTRADCSGRRLEGNAGVVSAALQPLALNCRFDGAQVAQLELNERRANTGFGRDDRRGRIVVGTVALELRSVHELEGTPLPLSHPAGYLMLRDGKSVAALELTDDIPRLRRSADAPAEAVTLAALALGLFWDPVKVLR